jgi:hypothetical protein
MEWRIQIPSEPVRNALMRWLCLSQLTYSYALGCFEFDTDGVMQFYDDANNELSFNTDDTWLELPNESA